MQILVLILGIGLLPKACALKCFECPPELSGSCIQTTKECPSNTQCGSVRMTSYAGGSKMLDIKAKSCAAAEECVQASVNFGVSQTLLTSKCCTSNLCNSQDAPEASISSPNGKKCFQCDGNDCTKTVNCNGNEDHCISAAVTAGGQKVTFKGCASKLICSGMQSAQIPGIGGAKMSCCQGDLCNSGSSTTVGLLLFVTPLISLVLFS
ncbi:urokinase plasminogen activator surface receptor-like [Astatotilapia calliptera]|uniref:UPAR/Ly6 domain-containing protein n=1 Tax=Astatotilapia calliptera TaxID=8154 RepID=A0A3P8Q6J9_ASTCA|nr:urokinase plasminogen activator surface receptor-like [Astatotilapia calliptera]